jgi:hypothetical protein
MVEAFVTLPTTQLLDTGVHVPTVAARLGQAVGRSIDARGPGGKLLRPSMSCDESAGRRTSRSTAESGYWP